MTNFDFDKVDFAILNKYLHSVNLFYCTTYTNGVFRTQLNIYNDVFLVMLKEAPP